MSLAASRFATMEEVLSEPFRAICREIDRFGKRYALPDHSTLNRERFPWSTGILTTPEFYASRLWEYPYAIISAELQPGMVCVDVGCGVTGFTPYLQEVARCQVIGVDPDLFEEGTRLGAHGVSRAFRTATSLDIRLGSMDALPIEDATVDRAFCISVIEHVPHAVAVKGMQEIARVLKPGGRAVITMDVNMLSVISRPLDLVWESGMTLPGGLDLRWPRSRFGIFCDGTQPADVIGFTLHKENYRVETSYRLGAGAVSETAAHLVPTLRARETPDSTGAVPPPGLLRRAVGRARRELGRVRRG